jgi:demethylmenaquinone methyltransferase/2-methoxy-6-polyprenyl-1,4-benzoquinol methylase
MSKASVAAYYAARAREYERIYQKPERQDDLRRLREFLGRALAGARVFEVACGTGYWTEIVARSAASVAASDINEEVLAIARRKPIDLQKVEFRQEDAFALRIPARKFSGGLAMFWWSHVPKADLRAFLRGFHGVPSPGARVVFVDNNYVEGSSTPIARADGRGNTYQQRRLEDGSRHEVLKNFPTESDLRAALEGLAEDARVETLRYYWILSYMAKAAVKSNKSC